MRRAWPVAKVDLTQRAGGLTSKPRFEILADFVYVEGSVWGAAGDPSICRGRPDGNSSWYGCAEQEALGVKAGEPIGPDVGVGTPGEIMPE
mmetsp:Transcript_17887/g.39259  ORF Transcript_17887/g.39259 Transcript_17887/m.39259 type:complete len:91 (-) Transcript_17887:2206-2478(-)